MNQSINDELSIFLELIREEMYALPENVLSSPIWQELDELITEQDVIDMEQYVLNKRLFNDFLEALQSYNHSSHEVEILEFLQDKALNILNLLRVYNSYSDSIETKKNTGHEVLEKRISSLKKGISILEEKQKKIDEQGNVVLARQQEANNIFEEFKNKNAAFSQLIDEQSNSQIGQLYRDIYNREITIADKYRNFALGIFAIVGFILILGFLNISIQNWNHLKDPTYIHIPLGWESLIKTLMLFSLTTPAWYLTRESSKHRKVAYKAQMLGTELASFPLYAREFKDEDRLELRKNLVDRFFGQELYSDSKTVQNSDSSLEQVKLLTEANKVLVESLKIKKVTE